MKKLLTLATFVAVVAAQAASIDWAIGGINKAKTQISDASGNAMNGTVYLIFANDASQLAAANTDTFSDVVNSIVLDSVAVSSGKISMAEPKTYTNNKPADEGGLVARSADGPQYSFQILVWDAANNSYYLSNTMSQYAYVSGTDDATQITFGKDDLGISSGNFSFTQIPAPGGSGGGETPGVPEPATGALALAGVALLFKRRRA